MKATEVIKGFRETYRRSTRLRRMWHRVLVTLLAFAAVVLINNLTDNQWFYFPFIWLGLHFSFLNVADAYNGREYVNKHARVVKEMGETIEKMKKASADGNFWEWNVHQKRFWELDREADYWSDMYNDNNEENK